MNAPIERHADAPTDALTRAPGREPTVRHFAPPAGTREAVVAALLRLSLRLTFKALMRPPAPVRLQRAVLHALSMPMPAARGVHVSHSRIGQMAVERIAPHGAAPRHVVLYLHGGAFCTGSPRSHRSITTQLAKLTASEVLVPHYRRAPEHPFPAQIEDAVASFRQLLRDGYLPHEIAIAGDSAGATLALMTAMALHRDRLPSPALLVLMSPAFEVPPTAADARARRDPMVNASWGRQAVAWYAAQPGHPLADPKAQDLSALPPTLIQVGDDEVLYGDAVWLSNAAAGAGRHAELEIYLKRWHVFQIHSAALPGSMAALRRQADFIRRNWHEAQAAARQGLPA